MPHQSIGASLCRHVTRTLSSATRATLLFLLYIAFITTTIVVFFFFVFALVVSDSIRNVLDAKAMLACRAVP